MSELRPVVRRLPMYEVRCKAVINSGLFRCSRVIASGSEYCWQHQKAAK